MHCPNCGDPLKEVEEVYQPLPGGHYDDIYYECLECESKFVSLYDSFNQQSELKELDEEEWREEIEKIRKLNKEVGG